jgi:hypothetical protein
MENHPQRDEGLKLLIKKCRNEFRRKENLEFYDDGDYSAAERKFVKFCLFDAAG